jgi:tetratricopeptide (TPR) repeat protein
VEYDTFNIRFQPGPRGSYSVIASSPRGEAPSEFRSPFADVDLENFVLRVGRPRRGIRRLDSPEMETAKMFGGRLFDALFSGDVRDLYHAASAEADSAGKGLRVTLRLGQAPELSTIPWEYLCEEGRFLSVSERTPIVRYLDLKKAHTPLALTPPLRIVGMVSSPSDVVELDVEGEKRRLEEALESLVKQGVVEIVWLERATLSALLEALNRDDFHVFHFIGHGAFDEREGDGVLLLEDERGRGKSVTGMKLGQLLADERTLRLAVLNACEGARTNREDPFAGVAASLVKNEIPSVVAMQFEITDKAAILFAGGLYAAVARGSPVDAALASARKAIWADYNDIEWGTPVLFMRIDDGRIFDVRADSLNLIREDNLDQPTLHAELVPSSTAVKQGEEVAWRLTVMNPTKTTVSQVTALRDDGSTLEAATELAPGRRSTTTWRTRPDADVDATVTVSALDIHGDRIAEQVSAHVTVERHSTPAAAAGDDAEGLASRQKERVARAAKLGEAQRLKGEYVGALAAFNNALEFEPDDFWALGARGDTLRALGRNEEALADLNRSLELEPDNAFALRVRVAALRLLGRSN